MALYLNVILCSPQRAHCALNLKNIGPLFSGSLSLIHLSPSFSTSLHFLHPTLLSLLRFHFAVSHLAHMIRALRNLKGLEELISLNHFYSLVYGVLAVCRALQPSLTSYYLFVCFFLEGKAC